VNKELVQSTINLLLLNLKHCSKEELDKLAFHIWAEQQDRDVGNAQ